MHYYEVAPNQIVRAGSSTFTYSHDTKLAIGQIVSIEVGKKQMIGVVVKQTSKPEYETKKISNIIENQPLPNQLVDLSIWMSKYYATPLAAVLQTILPQGLNKKRRQNSAKITEVTKRERTNFLFNTEQQTVLNQLSEHGAGTYLLQGITGSGKTEIYIELAKQSLANNQSIIMIVPEIALTSQLISEFANHFENLLVTHSKMTESNRHQIWLEALNSKIPRIVIGPRSALFTPLKNVGAIIIDEAHEPSLKQDQSPKYSALRAATILGRLHNAKVILGSATPSIADRYLADKANRPILRLNNIARANSQPPIITTIDMTKRGNFNNHRFFSKALIDQITTTIKEGNQVLIFHNRRGSTSSTLCKECGWTAICPRCYLPLTLHGDNHQMHCHICGLKSIVPTSCPECSSTDIIHKGIGTKLIESELRRIFPAANIARFDADNTTDETVNSRYGDLYNGIIDIAIGTQVVAKGLDLPHLRMVGIVQADAGLAIPDFNTNERTFQLLAQVIGRVGRNEHQTTVVVQSYQPNHPSVVYGLKQDYESFYKHALNERSRGLFPPFTHLLKLTCVYKTEAAAIKNSQKLATELRQKINPEVQILGPAPAFYERQHGTYRWQLILKSPKREYLIDTIKLVPSSNWQFDLDPSSLL